MAYIDDERRRRAGIGLTREREAWLAAAMEAQREGRPLPPLPTEMAGVRNPGDSDYVTPVGNERPTANQGQRVLSPAYTDPRSQAIAQTPAMIRPAHSMLDRLFRPGRADTANQMNREYKENALTGQVAGRSSRADMALKELELRARKGDTDALAGLEKYYKVEALRRGGGGVTPWGQFAADGSLSDGLGGSAKPKSEEGDDAAPPLDITRGDLTATQNRIQVRQRLAEIDELIAQQQQIVDRKPQKVRRQASGRDWRPNMPEYVDIPFEDSYSIDDIKAAPQKLLDLQQKKKQMLQVLEEASAPLTSPVTGGPDMGSPNRSTIDQ